MNDDDLIRRGDAFAVVKGLSLLEGDILALHAVTVGVKPLVWVEDFADHPFGWYESIDCGDCIVLTQSGVSVGSFHDIATAKAAAQADYEARILAALEPVTQPAPDAHVNETPKTEHDAGNVLTPAPDAAAIREADWQKQQRVSAMRRRHINAPEDPHVAVLCERYGYGAVMDAASRLWARQDSVGAFYIGGCIGLRSDDEAAALLTEKPHDR